MSADQDKEIHEKLSKKYACYVLITCTPPKDDGDMNVEMHYEGPKPLASYLVEGARSFFEEEEALEVENYL